MSQSSEPWPSLTEIEIQPEAVAALQVASTAFRLIDCREVDEWNTAKIEGAELLPLGDFGARYNTLLTDPNASIVIHCHHGMRSAKAALFLRQKGYQRVWSMARGIEGWSLEVDARVPRY